jgi:hypothetical protein
MVQELLNEGGTDAKITEAIIEKRLLKHRILDYNNLVEFLGKRNDIEVDTTTALATVTMKDIYGTYQYFAGAHGVHLHPDGRYFLVNDTEYVEDSGCGFTFDPEAFTLDFNEAFSGEVDVYAVGHVVNIEGPYGVMYDCIGVLIGWVSKLANVRGQEFKNLIKNLEHWRQTQYGASQTFGGFRVHS